MTTPHNALVWGELPVTDLDAASAFYASVLDAPVRKMEMGGDTVAALPYGDGGVSADLFVPRPGQPKRATMFIDVGALEPAMERCTRAGGAIHGEIVDIPPGRFAYATDPDGNSIGLFERRG